MRRQSKKSRVAPGHARGSTFSGARTLTRRSLACNGYEAPEGAGSIRESQQEPPSLSGSAFEQSSIPRYAAAVRQSEVRSWRSAGRTPRVRVLLEGAWVAKPRFLAGLPMFALLRWRGRRVWLRLGFRRCRGRRRCGTLGPRNVLRHTRVSALGHRVHQGHDCCNRKNKRDQGRRTALARVAGAERVGPVWIVLMRLRRMLQARGRRFLMTHQSVS